MHAKRLHTLVDFLERLGVGFALDFDEELQTTFPLLAPTSADLAAIVDEHRVEIVQILNRRRHFRLRVFVGGPYNGKRHGMYDSVPFRNRAVRYEPGKWAVYQATEQPWDDPRLHFLGYASSEAKGRHGKLLPKRTEGKS